MWTTVSFWKTGKPRANRQTQISRLQISKAYQQPHFTVSRHVARARKEGIMSVLVDEAWIHVTRGSFILVFGGVTHDLENRNDTRAGRYRARLSATCLTSRSGLPKIHPKMQASTRRVSTLKTTKSFSLRPRAFSVAVVHLPLVRP
jgi:hypothetical protein